PLLARFAAALQQRHGGIVPTVLSMSSQQLEAGLENLSLDLALGYTERRDRTGIQVTAWPQSIEHYFLLRRAAQPSSDMLRICAPLRWSDAAAMPLCLLTPDMHNRAIVDQALSAAGATVAPAIETDSVLALALCVAEGEVCSILPGAMVAAVRSHRELEALPLVDPGVRTPIGFMSQTGVRPSRALQAAIDLLQGDAWLANVARHSGSLG
ncbi:MAG: LysR family transcriptional regulator substrate-binding protein, partial [Gammaproteobacteria bacterium]|nr:LysR family transcriptional regulator substrate-binding protein [Gammaproteobacteria bacterium]